MQLRQEISCVFDHGRIAAAEERLPQRVQALDAEKILHHDMALSRCQNMRCGCRWLIDAIFSSSVKVHVFTCLTQRSHQPEKMYIWGFLREAYLISYP